MPSSRTEPPFELLPHSKTRQAIAERVSQSTREKPTFSMQIAVDASAVLAARQEWKTRAAGRRVPTVNDVLIRAVAQALPSYPRLNAWYAPEGVQALQVVNVGFAAATPDGVLLPTVFDADHKTVWEIAEETAAMVEAARNGKLRAGLQMGAGFTVSNIGPVGVDWFQAIISPPQAAILAAGSVAPRPVVVGDAVVARPVVLLTLTVDHRVADGAEAAPFLAELRGRLEGWNADME